MWRSSFFRQCLRSLWRNKLRSFLTVLGIVTGVGSFICAVGIGSAGSAKVEAQLRSLGDNMIWVEAGSRSRNGVRNGARGTRSLVLADMQAIQSQVPLIRIQTPNADGRITVVYNKRNWYTSYRGVTPEFFEIRKWELQSGALFTKEDVDRAVPVCVLGQTAADNLFFDEDPVGKIVRVRDMPCKVVGTLRRKGASVTGQDQDDFLILPYTTVQKRITGEFWLDDIFCSAVSGEAIPEAKRQIITLLRERHHMNPGEDDDFNIRTPEELIQAQLATAEVFTLLLAAISSLSLLVGGIGIMNIMLVTVTERTREIGVRLAVGATEWDIRAQFLSEAVAISLFGGLLGVLAGFGGAVAVQSLLHWDMEVTRTVVLVGCLFSVVLGVTCGYYPADRAAQLNPIEALRFE
ncbi:MAG TPA: ABC transporter permease [Terriglobales bacterium]|nr:ABC transporter permease [Terriglobales bacterium]